MAEIEDFVNRYEENNDMEVLSDLFWDICNGSITKEEVLYRIDKLKSPKDQVLMGYLVNLLNMHWVYLLDHYMVFNFLFNKGEWPEIWAEGLINPVNKKGSKDVEDNYRKVTVLPELQINIWKLRYG